MVSAYSNKSTSYNIYCTWICTYCVSRALNKNKKKVVNTRIYIYGPRWPWNGLVVPPVHRLGNRRYKPSDNDRNYKKKTIARFEYIINIPYGILRLRGRPPKFRYFNKHRRYYLNTVRVFFLRALTWTNIVRPCNRKTARCTWASICCRRRNRNTVCSICRLRTKRPVCRRQYFRCDSSGSKCTCWLLTGDKTKKKKTNHVK